MTVFNFNKLSLKEKGELVFNTSGKYIATWEYNNQRLVLYDMGDFFAEVWYKPNENEIWCIAG